MLLPGQVIPFLQHEDADVRAHAADYLAKAHDPSPATAEDFWRSIDRFGADASAALLVRLADLPQNEASLDRLLDALRKGFGRERTKHLHRACATVDFGLLSARRDDLTSTQVLPPDVRDHLRQRLELEGQPAAELWDRLQKYSEKIRHAHWGDFDTRVSDRLVEALARHCQAAGALVSDYLSGPRRAEEWMELFVVQLAGALRHEPVTDRLLELLGDDGDLMVEDAVLALARIGTPAVIEGVEAYYRGAEWGPRLSATSVLGRIKRPESEAALMRLMQTETDTGLLTSVAMYLCDLCTTEGLEPIRRIIVEDRYDPETEDLELLLLTVGKMVGYTPPEAEAWRLNPSREKRLRARAEKYPALEALVKALSAFSDPDQALSPLPPPGAYAGEIRREAPKVGRNDACPCGSGKKYKKCCLNASNAANA